MKEQKTFRDSEALKEIKPLPMVHEPKEKEKPEVEIIDDPESFRMAIGHAQMAKSEGTGDGCIEVSERMFKYLIRNQKTRYITYGDPGIKVYLAGTRAEMDKEDMMNCEEYSKYMNEKRKKD